MTRFRRWKFKNVGKLEGDEKFLEVVDSALETDGIIIGKTMDNKVVAIPKNSPYNKNICVCGSQNTGKSDSFVKNMIIQCAVRGESFVVTDPKSEYIDMVSYLKKEGYNVYLWNLIDHLNSNSWNPLVKINEREVDILCECIIKNSKNSEEPYDFVDKFEEVLLKALVLYVANERPEEEHTLVNVYKMLLEETVESLDEKFAKLSKEHPASGYYDVLNKSSSNKKNAMLGLAARLRILHTESIQKMLASNEIDMKKIAQEKAAIFCIASDSNTTYSMLNALFLAMLFEKLFDYVENAPACKCDVPVHFILDELPNIGIIPDFKLRLAICRSRNIHISFSFHNVPQLEHRFPGGVWEELIGGCDYRIFFGCNEMTTAKYWSDLTGILSIGVDKKSKKWDIKSEKQVYIPEEILHMDPDELLLFVRGQQPIRLKKFKFFEHPKALNIK